MEQFNIKRLFVRPQKSNPNAAHYTIGEEIANGVTHGIGVAFTISGITLLLVFAVMMGNLTHIVAFSIYGTSMFLLYLASTLYHSLQVPSAKRVFQVLDHAAIYLLIAGTYTPFLVISIRSLAGWLMLTTVWTIAIVGIVFKVFFINRFQTASTLAYVGMGWIGVIGWQELFSNLPEGAVSWVVAGGVTYTAGVLFYAMDGVKYSHAVWHLFVLGGSVCHFIAMFYLIPWA